MNEWKKNDQVVVVVGFFDSFVDWSSISSQFSKSFSSISFLWLFYWKNSKNSNKSLLLLEFDISFRFFFVIKIWNFFYYLIINSYLFRLFYLCVCVFACESFKLDIYYTGIFINTLFSFDWNLRFRTKKSKQNGMYIFLY